MSALPQAAARQWPDIDAARVPNWVYTDPVIFARELEHIFNAGDWLYVCLEAEIPKPGSFKRSQLGNRDVVAVRGADGAINVMVNRCAHRSMQFCSATRGTVKEFVCPYHQWTYDLSGNLQSLPFRRGYRGQGGMPADFQLENHGIQRLAVTTRNGVVFASFGSPNESLETYLGERMLGYFDRVFDGRALTILGYSRQRIDGNWKLMQENIKDPYHPGLLHTWFVTFGLWRADNKSELKMDRHHRHAAMISTRGASGKAEQVTQVSSFKESMKLNDDRFLDIVPEAWWGGPTAVMMTLFPSVILQQQVNSVSTRHIQPSGPGAFDFVWTHFGFEDDTAEMTQRRLRQANLFGPAGFVSADDGEVIELSQKGFEQKPFHRTLAELGGREVGDTDHMVTETLIRGMYEYWRKVMEA